MKKQLGILAIAVAMAVSSFANAAFADIAPMENNRYVFIPVANDAGVKYNNDYSYYTSQPDGSNYSALPGAADNTYFIKADGGGLNEMHLASSSSLAFGDITHLTSNTTSPSGSFYITNTGGRGFDDNLVVLLSVTGTVSNSFSVNIKSSGYSWSIPPGGTYQPIIPTDAEYVSGINETFSKTDFQYGPQTMKPGPGGLGGWTLPFYYGQNTSDSSTASYLMFIDLYVGNMKDGSIPFIEEHGAAKVEYSFSGLTPGSTVAFNSYGWCSAANQGEGISWTNRTNGTDFSSSSYAITVDPNAPAPVPIPAAAWLLGSGLAGLGFLRRKFFSA